MKIGVLGLCSAPGTAFAVKQIVSHAKVRGFEAVAVQRKNSDEEVNTYLQTCDVVVSHYLPSRFGALATDALKASVSGKVIIIPHISFSGFYPDMIYLKDSDGNAITTALGPYNSQIVAAGFASNIPEEKVATLFRFEVFQALKYFEEYAKAKSFLIKSYNNQNLDISKAFGRWEARGVFMHTINHPKQYVLFDIISEIMKAENIIEDAPLLEIHAVDHLLSHPIWPVYPDIADALNISGGSYLFKSYGFSDVLTGEIPLMNLNEFIESSYGAYRKRQTDRFEAAEIEKAREIIEKFI